MLNSVYKWLFSGVNSLCVDGICDCIRDHSGDCVAYPPDTCGDCDAGLTCDNTSGYCVIPRDRGQRTCMST